MRRTLSGALLLATWCGVADLAAAKPVQIERILADVERSEYEFAFTEQGAWSAPNRAHDLRTSVAASFVELTSRVHGPDEEQAGFSLRLRALAWGRDAATVPLPEASLDGRSEQVIVHSGPVEASYANDPGGMRQRLTIDRAPHGASADSPLVLELALEGLAAYPDAERRTLVLKTGAGKPVLRYSIDVLDAAARPLRAELDAAPGSLRIRVWDDGAVYPIVIASVMTSPVWTFESNQDSANLGYSVAVAGDVDGDGFSEVIVGAPLFDTGTGTGRAFLFRGGAAGPSFAPAWTGNAQQFGSRFGYAVGPAGDVNADGFADVLVGEPLYIAATSNEGRAYLFLGSAAGLATSPAWTAEGTQAGEQLGRALGTAGDVNGDGYDDVIVAAPLYDTPAPDSGRVLFYHGSAAGLGSPAWSAEPSQGGARFGESVHTAGDVNGDGYADVIIGAPLFDDTFLDEGRAFVWHGSPSGLANNLAWLANSQQQSAFLGSSVAGAGDVNGDGYGDVIVGAYAYEDSPAQSGEGRVFVWYGGPIGLGSNGTPANVDRAFESEQAGATLGWSVGPAGDLNGDGYADILMAAPSFTNDQTDEGRVWAYLGSATGIAPSPYWIVEGNQADSQFGQALGTAGDVNGDGFSDVVVGANWFDNGQTTEGRAFVYLGGGDPTAAQPSSRLQAGQVDGRVGSAVAGAGDVNGDGYSDVIVGAPTFDNGQAEEGRAFVYYGSPAGINPPASWTAEGNQTAAFFGVSVAAAGDVNGDGYGDVVIGAHQFDNGQTDEGRAFVYHGSASGLGSSAAWTTEANQTGALYGASVASAGDLDADGYGDIVVGAPLRDGAFTNEGWAYAYKGSPLGLNTSATWTAQGGQHNAQLGTSVSGAGDVDRDGNSDILVGVPYFDAPGPVVDVGQARLYRGTFNAATPSPAWTVSGSQAGELFGASVTAAGDVNGDGFSDVLVGAPQHDSGDIDEGRALIYFGAPGGPGALPAWFVDGNQQDCLLGFSVSSAGDVNGDGYGDVLVGAPRLDDGQASEGRAFVYLGSASGPSVTSAWGFDNDVAGSLFGRSVGAAGDVNGDGFGDIIVGSPEYNDGIGTEGRAWVFLGNGGDGLDRAARQRRASNTAPIGPLGLSDSETSFRLAGLARSAAGRGRVRMEWEAKALDVLFDSTGIVAGPFVDTGAPTGTGSAAQANEVVSGLLASKQVRWRLRMSSRSPYFPHSPWISPPWNGATEADLRAKVVDADGDGLHSEEDCADGDPGVWKPPTVVETSLVFGFPGVLVLTWPHQSASAGSSTVYDVQTGLIADVVASGGFSSGACFAEDLPFPPEIDFSTTPVPGPGQVIYFMVRAQNACGTGSWGSALRDATAGACN